ncbi:GNAT family N-acetyltransferase [Paraburkholderia fynbosensis]|uniref:Mycothiol acetyltransferase n=1 Tax=Paraburkholderia fynbosensis TaxID=1200993 RepID=A0A6J5GUK8_9BURK|nr:GNAT family N-acetyltransferase [Paraburkholderia fynbosensis]CAB3806510.1 Mycothiol acetyltransferase [Paraburkholderia fynbosensis]
MNRPTQLILDNPVWSALTTKQAHLREGNRPACRYHPDIAPFAGVESETEAAFHELGALLPPPEQVALLSLAPLPHMEAMRSERIGVVRQMVATGDPAGGTNDQVIRLTDLDAADMLELVQKTKPGPFGKRTHQMGHYIGIRDGGRLIAMAGERMRLDGYIEISAVCVDDEYRGKGLAARLMNILRREIRQRGDIPFLHVFDDNHPAIALYERLGFETRQTFLLYRIKGSDPVAA